jgi:hypothetical protein
MIKPVSKRTDLDPQIPLALIHVAKEFCRNEPGTVIEFAHKRCTRFSVHFNVITQTSKGPIRRSHSIWRYVNPSVFERVINEALVRNTAQEAFWKELERKLELGDETIAEEAAFMQDTVKEVKWEDMPQIPEEDWVNVFPKEDDVE